MKSLGVLGLLAATAVSGMVATQAAASTYDSTVESYDPLAYYNLANSSGSTTTDAVNGYTMTLNNGASVVAGSGPVINGSAAPSLVLANGSGGSEYAGSGGSNPEAGGISNAGSVIAWINLAALPSTVGRIFSIAGTSAGGDDFDFQIDPSDNTVRFYTDGGSYTESSSLTSADVGQWLFVAGTFTANTDRQVYVDGSLVGSSAPGGHSDSGNPFYIGQSNVFGGRYFDGSIADVAFYNTDLIYDSASAISSVSAAPEPSTWLLMIAGIGGIGLMLRQARRKTGFRLKKSFAA